MNTHACKSDFVPTLDPVRDATIAALKRVLDPLLEVMFDSGVTVQELNKITRDRAVRVATRRVMKETGRQSNSRVAIMTGLPRSEVSKILVDREQVQRTKPDQHPARRVLAGWYDDPIFAAPSGAPAILPIFGKRRSFERLVERYGGGIPVRAMLDELVQSNAIEKINNQEIKAKSRVPVSTGLSSRSIASLGERGRDLLATLAHNVRRGTQPLFEATAVIEETDGETASLMRREISEQGASFISGATSLFNRSRQKRKTNTEKSTAKYRLGVTVYYFENKIADSANETEPEIQSRRKNLRRRKSRPTKLSGPKGGTGDSNYEETGQ